MPLPADQSIFLLNQTGSGAVSVASGAEALFHSPGNRVIAWEAIPGANIRIGLQGLFNTTAGTATIRIRAEGTTRNIVDGTEIHSFMVSGPTNVLETVDIVKPSGASYLKVTAENATGNTSVTGGALTITNMDFSPTTGFALNRGFDHQSFTNGVEIVRAQWLVDFDVLGETVGTFFGLGGVFSRTFTDDGKQVRVRVGGTADVADGDEVILHNETSGVEICRAVSNVVAPITGVQLVKLTVLTDDGFGGFPVVVYDPSILVRAA